MQVDEKRSLENAHTLFRGYTAKFINQGYIPKQVEVPFDIEVGISLRGNVIHRTGIFDELCIFGGRPYVLDFKSTSIYPGATWMDAWRTNDQFMGYLWAARQVFGEAHGVIVHGVWVHSPAKTSRAKYKLDDYFTSDIITFTDKQIEEWRTKFLRVMDRMQDDQASGQYDSNWGTACKAYGVLCDYHKWCSADPGARPMVENIYYERIAWTPLAEERLSQLEAA